jgi:hypothetical protein
MEVKIRDSVGCTIEGDLKEKELEKFKALGWVVVWFKEGQTIRYPETEDEEIKELQRADFEELSKKGETSCLTDLFINAGM